MATETGDAGGTGVVAPPTSLGSGLLRQSSLTAVVAAASVVSGLLLDVAIAMTFGANRTTDAFFVAARLPVFAVTVLMAGAYQALAPTFAIWFTRRGEREVWASSTSLLAIVGVIGTAVALAVYLAAPAVVALTAPGLGASPSAIAADLLRILAVVVPLTAIAESLRALLNARYSFVAPAAMYAVSNVAAMVIVLAAGPGSSIRVVAWAYVVGAALRLVFVLGVAWRNGFRPRRAEGGHLLKDPDALYAMRLCSRPVAAAGFPPIARLVETGFASFLPPGSITILNYGYRLVFAVGGTIFFRSIVATLIPRLAEATEHGQSDRVARITGKGVILVTSIAIPLTVFLATLGVPAALALFDRGSFGRQDASRLGVVVAILSLALLGEALQRVLLAPFFAALDTRTPLRNAFYGSAANLVLLPILVLPVAGTSSALIAIALAFTLSEYVGPVHAWRRLRGDIGAPWVELWSTLRRVVPPAFAAGIACWLLSTAFELTQRRPLPITFVLLAVTTIAGIAVLLVGMSATCGSELRQVWGALSRRST